MNWAKLTAYFVSVPLSYLKPNPRTCFFEASQPYTGAWLTALLASSLGDLLSNNCLRYALALHTGSNVCQNFICRCVKEVNKFEQHPLSCVKSGSCYSRHCALNVAGFNSILEPSTLMLVKGPTALLFFRIKKESP